MNCVTDRLFAAQILIILVSDFKIGLRVVAYGAYCRCGSADDDMSAVAAFPYCYAALLKYCLFLNVFEERSVAFFMSLFDSSNTSELFCEVVETLFVGFFSHTVVHIGPLEILALCCAFEVIFGRAEFAESLEPHLSVFLFVVGCF